jgi:hypothetical protein
MANGCSIHKNREPSCSICKHIPGIPFDMLPLDVIPLRDPLAFAFGRPLVTDENGVVRLADLPPAPIPVVNSIADVLKKPKTTAAKISPAPPFAP